MLRRGLTWRSGVWFALLLLLLSCRQTAPDVTPRVGATVVAPTLPPVGVTSAPATPTVGDTATVPPATTAAPPAIGDAPATLPPGPTLPRFVNTPATADQRIALTALQQLTAPVRDDIALAIDYFGYDPAAPAAPPPGPFAVNDTDTVTLVRFTDDAAISVDITLRYVSDHAYFWFDDAGNAPLMASPANLAAMGLAFDTIYDEVRRYFGPEDNPGVDNDPRIHIINASTESLCNSVSSCGILGYFSGSDALPRGVSAVSNERDMFIMNATTFGTELYVDVLTHEFRHMIEDNYDTSEDDWSIEGSAVLSQVLLGYTASAQSRANAFLSDPNQNPLSWGTSSNGYGHGYMLSQFLFTQLGEAGYLAVATHPDNGFETVDALNLGIDSVTLWNNFFVALALLNTSTIPPQYAVGDLRYNSVASRALPADGSERLGFAAQYGSSYFTVDGSDTVELIFEGSSVTQLLHELPTSGERMWIAERNNFQHATLTRLLDLRAVDGATLQYDIAYDIEATYDFAFVSVSTDGVTWTGLAAPGMESVATGDDPGQRSFTPHFYSAPMRSWQTEQIDLSAYAGQQIWLRFSYVTDQRVTGHGVALDNIMVPEIGLYETGDEMLAGWEPAGFLWTSGYLAQPWSVQLVTFPVGGPVVTQLLSDPLTPTGNITLDLADYSRPPIVIIAALAPQTQNDAAFALRVVR